MPSVDHNWNGSIWAAAVKTGKGHTMPTAVSAAAAAAAAMPFNHHLALGGGIQGIIR
jgi:hypothetical protein